MNKHIYLQMQTVHWQESPVARVARINAACVAVNLDALYMPPVTKSDGAYTIAHDALDHPLGYPILGDYLDELRAVGAGWYSRVGLGDVSGCGTDPIKGPELCLAETIFDQLYDAAVRQPYLLSGHCKRPSDFDDPTYQYFLGISQEALRRLDSYMRANGEDRLKCSSHENLAAILYQGYYRQRRKYESAGKTREDAHILYQDLVFHVGSIFRCVNEDHDSLGHSRFVISYTMEKGRPFCVRSRGLGEARKFYESWTSQ